MRIAGSAIDMMSVSVSRHECVIERRTKMRPADAAPMRRDTLVMIVGS
jgi:hypothetical protein